MTPTHVYIRLIIDIIYTITCDSQSFHCQVIYSANEKRIQFENRTLRSRARNNYMNMLTVVPILTSCWLSLLLIASMGGLAFDDANSHRDIKYVCKCEIFIILRKHAHRCYKPSVNLTLLTFSKPFYHFFLICYSMFKHSKLKSCTFSLQFMKRFGNSSLKRFQQFAC